MAPSVAENVSLHMSVHVQRAESGATSALGDWLVLEWQRKAGVSQLSTLHFHRQPSSHIFRSLTITPPRTLQPGDGVMVLQQRPRSLNEQRPSPMCPPPTLGPLLTAWLKRWRSVASRGAFSRCASLRCL